MRLLIKENYHVSIPKRDFIGFRRAEFFGFECGIKEFQSLKGILSDLDFVLEIQTFFLTGFNP